MIKKRAFEHSSSTSGYAHRPQGHNDPTGPSQAMTRYNRLSAVPTWSIMVYASDLAHAKIGSQGQMHVYISMRLMYETSPTSDETTDVDMREREA